MTLKEDQIKTQRSKFQRHTYVLMWKSLIQRQRKWRVLLAESIFAIFMFALAVSLALPVFIAPVKDPHKTGNILQRFRQQNKKSIVGYAPDKEPYVEIMHYVQYTLNMSIMRGRTEFELNNNLYKAVKSSSHLLNRNVIWIIFDEREGNIWKYSIHMSERALREIGDDKQRRAPDPNDGFIAVMLIVSQAIIFYQTLVHARLWPYITAMPVSALMQHDQVRNCMSGILLYFTVALIPPVLETQALVIKETQNKFKRSLRMRSVGYLPMYIGWLTFAYLTLAPICVVAAVMLVVIFRWMHLLYGLVIMLSYASIMIMAALVMAMFHSKAWVACLWTTLFILLQTYLAELIVHHKYDQLHIVLTGLLQMILPPLGLVHILNDFVLLQSGTAAEDQTIPYSLASWSVAIVFYFVLLMLLQRTIGHQRAIGGQVPLTSIIFKKMERTDKQELIEQPTGRERAKLQEVDELMTKAISFENVSKSIMGVEILDKITLDIYRGEFTTLFAERVERKIIDTVEDLLTGLSYADSGKIRILGYHLRPGENFMTVPHMIGYCHDANFLIPELTADEHFTLFNDICLWRESREYILQYAQLHEQPLLARCNLADVREVVVGRLDPYYSAQLCWALALLMEPRIVIIPYLMDQHPNYIMVIKDKIMQYKKYMSLIEMSNSSAQFEYADRVFIFDRKVLAFGGTPAYMFFKFGREYRVRLTIQSDEGSADEGSIKNLMVRAAEAGATVRARIGSLLVLRVSTSPTKPMAELIQELQWNADRYRITSMNVSVPDSEEVYKRAMMESTEAVYETTPATYETSKVALKKFSTEQWKRRVTFFSLFLHLRIVAWKYYTFVVYYKFYFVMTVVAALLAGAIIGLSLSLMLTRKLDFANKKIEQGEKLTMDNLKYDTRIMLQSDNNAGSISVLNSYVFSEPGSTKEQISNIAYSAFPHTESLKQYLMTFATEYPQLYVGMFAYGMEIRNHSGISVIEALYNPMHPDKETAERSFAKVLTTLMRHISKNLSTSIEVTDKPLVLDLTPWKSVAETPLSLQFLLIMAISHTILIPSMEHGLIRHVQSHAMNFSPARYWLTLYFCDLILYWFLVSLITGAIVLILCLSVPVSTLHLYTELLAVPFMLTLYGFACIPQAYIFSLGSRVALNMMTFIIVNLIFSETTIIAKIFEGKTLDMVKRLMNIFPQFNMAVSIVKIKRIFLYNGECVAFTYQSLCTNRTFHKCCPKCGILQECYSRRQYLSRSPGIVGEVIAMFVTAAFFMSILLILSYKVPQRIWMFLKCARTVGPPDRVLQPGAESEKQKIIAKWRQIQRGQRANEKYDTYGETFLARNLAYSELGVFKIHSVYLGVGKGEVLGLSGLKRHGRVELVEMLGGIRQPSQGYACCMSRWNHRVHPYLYARNISVSSGEEPLPPWMTVYDALEMLAMLRGVPCAYVKNELRSIIDALQLSKYVKVPICRLAESVHRKRLHFAAAVVGAPPIIVLDECTAHQNFAVQRSMYKILQVLKNRGHSIFISSSSLETLMPLTNRLAILFDSTIYDVDTIDELVARYSAQGFTVVVHLKDEVDVTAMFAVHFQHFVINDTSDVLVNVQVMDSTLNWANVFRKMELLKNMNEQVYSYIITVTPIDYIYNSIISNDKTSRIASHVPRRWKMWRSMKIRPTEEMLESLIPFEKKYDITKLKELPWSVIFQT